MTEISEEKTAKFLRLQYLIIINNENVENEKKYKLFSLSL